VARAGGGRQGWDHEWGTFEQIRRDRDRDGLSIRALAARHGVHRRAVREALASPLPSPRKRPEGRPAPKLGEYRELIDEWLIADLDAPRKQRHTAHRVWERLGEEHGAEVSEHAVRKWVAHRRRELGEPPAAMGSPRARPRHRGRGRLGRGGRDPQRRPHQGVHLPYARLSLGWELRDGFPARDPAGVPRGPRRGV
jgi:transposase